ncbi:MAG TPA: hypothetical protein VEB64_14475 [Azospirillaceae bacterium]|nr:hypothetical protein [Azospirillaceae bacterium]
MSDSVAQQIVAIHSMLSAGHRSLRIERHTLVLWGVAGGALMLFGDSILTEDQFPVLERRALAWLALLTLVLGGVGALDWHLTRHAKRVRDEAWSFIHRQVLKVWWLLMAIGTLLTFATFFFGGGYMLCAAWLVLIGLGLYVHGLFSEELLEWIGALVIATGTVSLCYRLDFETMRWIAASVMGLGLPLLAAMLDRGRARPSWHRAMQSAAWMLVVLGVPLAAHVSTRPAVASDMATISLDAFRKEAPAGDRIVAIPAGTSVPVEIEVTGTAFRNSRIVFPLTLAAPLEVVTADGTPTGSVRFLGESWATANEALLIRIPAIKATLTPGQGPVVHATLETEIKAAQRR